MGDIQTATGIRTSLSTAPGETAIALLIRHAHTDAAGRMLAGRAEGVPLSTTGRHQADRLGRALASLPLAAIYTSPLERARDTARAIARHQSIEVRDDPDLNEIDFGEWTGLTFEELADLPAWRLFNRDRAAATIPGGEQPLAVQDRIVGAIDRLCARHAGRTIAMVTHCDVIRTAVLRILGGPLGCYDRFEISPASITAVEVSARSRRLLSMNGTHAPPP